MERWSSVVPAAKKSKLGPIFFSKYPCHIQTVGEKAKNRTKKQQKPSKKGVFSSTSGQLAEFGRIWTCRDPAWPDMEVHIQPDRVWTCPYPAWLDLVLSISGRPGRIWSGPDPARPDMDFHIRPGRIWTCPYPAKLSQLAGGAGKKHLFWRVFASFSSCFLLFHGPFVCTKPFLQKKIGPFDLL